MAARRLLIVMLILLGLSTLAAALVPPQSKQEGTDTTTTTDTTESPADAGPRGQELTVTISVGGKTIPVVPLEAGDQLDLTICSKQGDEVEIPAFGLVDTIVPPAPAHFDLLAETPGSYGIKFVSTDRIVARLQVAKPRKKEEKKKEPRKSRARAGSCPA